MKFFDCFEGYSWCVDEKGKFIEGTIVQPSIDCKEDCPLADCKKDNWTQVYSQNTPLSSFESCKLGDCNIRVDEDNFINFNLLKPSGPYNFKLQWESKGETQYMTWVQDKNPLASVNQDMNAQNVAYSNNLWPFDGFNGLSLSSRGDDRTLIDGLGKHNDWWYSVGYKKSG